MRIGRPIIFRQQRVGQGGRLFTVYKFRTMTGDRRSQELAVEGDDRRVSHKRDDDPRLTPALVGGATVVPEAIVESLKGPCVRTRHARANPSAQWSSVGVQAPLSR
jgi:hypothetical protein